MQHWKEDDTEIENEIEQTKRVNEPWVLISSPAKVHGFKVYELTDIAHR